MSTQRFEQLVRSYSFVALGRERGQWMARLIDRSICPLGTLSVLDLGCRLGEITASFAQVCQRVVGIDVVYDWERQEGWREKLSERAVTNLSFANADGLKLPFPDSTFDLVLVNGVLEWVGGVKSPHDPREVQMRLLREVRRVLRDGGAVYLAIENRLFPGYVLKDPHTQIPLVGIMPRKLANGIAERFYHKPYRTYTYSFWELERLMRESGFTSLSAYVPVYTYWFPCAIHPVSDRKGIMQSLASLDLSGASDEYARAALVTDRQRFFFRLIVFLGLTKVFCNAFVVFGRK